MTRPYKCSEILFLIDVNECAHSSANNCSAVDNEECHNVEGSYQCDCVAGFERIQGICKGIMHAAIIINALKIITISIHCRYR